MSPEKKAKRWKLRLSYAHSKSVIERIARAIAEGAVPVTAKEFVDVLHDVAMQQKNKDVATIKGIASLSLHAEYGSVLLHAADRLDERTVME